jgi:predicted nucleic acid-binding protein
MSGIKYLLDTNIIIGMYERSSNVINLFANKRVTINECSYSSVTRMELLGFPEISANEIKIISALLNQMTQLSIDRTIEDKTIDLKQQHRIKLPDAIILATAISHDIELLTLDKKLANKK